MKLHTKAFALAFGIVYGAGMLVFGLFATAGIGNELAEMIGTIYIGFGPSVVGAIIGGVWGFVEGLIFGWLIALCYNKLAT